jgi:hypothetical protein
MTSLLLAFACGGAAPARVDLDPAWDTVEDAVHGGSVKKQTAESLVVVYPAGTDPTVTAARYLHALEAAGHTVEAPKPAGPATLWNTQKDGSELLVAAVSTKGGVEIHLDW